MHYAIIDLYAGTTNAEQKKRDARLAVLFSYSRVVLRLNLTEPMHVELRQRLDEFMTVDRVTPDRERIEGAVDLARKILKQEWEVTKYGPLTGWIQRLKSPKRSN